MLRTFKVRSKLFLVLALPLVALIAFASLGVRDRLDEADQASGTTDLVVLADRQAQLSDELHREQLWTAAVVASKGAVGREGLLAQRAATDAAATTFRTVAATDAGAALAADRDGALAALDGLDTARSLADSGATAADVVVSRFNQVSSGIAGVSRGVAALVEDPVVIRSMQTTQTLASMEDSVAALATSIVRVSLAGDGTAAERTALQFQFDRVSTEESRFDQVADDALRSAYQDLRQTPEARRFDQLLVTFRGQGGTNTVDPAQLLSATGLRLDAIEATRNQVYGAVLDHADEVQRDATRQARQFALTAGIATLLAILLAGAVARSITKPLGRLTGAANDLSQEKLPRLLAQLEAPDADPSSFALEPIDVRSGDEIGQLAGAFNRLQQATSTVANEQASLLRKGIGDIFVNLARRNQSLLDRQIEFIDQLEANEEDPDQLENLFKLDHLATRMRRNAESLLVLAGAEPPRRRGRPVDMADVVRVAVGEVEQFSRITLLALDDATVGGNVATDLAHLLSELMENATQFSPPDTVVEIVGHLARDGSYVLSVSDKGIGMTAEQLAEANARIAHPPVLGLSFSRSLGFTVIGRLAQRLGLTVRLTASLVGGVSALVSIPAAVVSPGGAEVTAAPPTDAGGPPAEVAEVADAPAPLAPWDGDLARRRGAPVVPVEHPPIVMGPLRQAGPTPILEPQPAPPEPAAPEADTPATLADAPVAHDAPAALADAPTSDDPPVDVAGAIRAIDDAARNGSRYAAPPVPPSPVEATPVAGLSAAQQPTTELPDPQVPADPWPTHPQAPAPVPPTEVPVAEVPAPPPPPPPGTPEGVAAWLVPPPPPSLGDLPRRGGATPDGPPLPSRNPGATTGGLTRRTPGSVEPTLGLAGRPAAAATGRSPDEVRQMLSKYRSGLARGREHDRDESAGTPGEEG